MLMAQGRPAKLHYRANGFQVLVAGDHVVCARTGAAIALEDLRYWSVLGQEAYANAFAAREAAERAV